MASTGPRFAPLPPPRNAVAELGYSAPSGAGVANACVSLLQQRHKTRLPANSVPKKEAQPVTFVAVVWCPLPPNHLRSAHDVIAPAEAGPYTRRAAAPTSP